MPRSPGTQTHLGEGANWPAGAPQRMVGELGREKGGGRRGRGGVRLFLLFLSSVLSAAPTLSRLWCCLPNPHALLARIFYIWERECQRFPGKHALYIHGHQAALCPSRLGCPGGWAVGQLQQTPRPCSGGGEPATLTRSCGGAVWLRRSGRRPR